MHQCTHGPLHVYGLARQVMCRGLRAMAKFVQMNPQDAPPRSRWALQAQNGATVSVRWMSCRVTHPPPPPPHTHTAPAVASGHPPTDPPPPRPDGRPAGLQDSAGMSGRDLLRQEPDGLV